MPVRTRDYRQSSRERELQRNSENEQERGDGTGRREGGWAHRRGAREKSGGHVPPWPETR